MSISLSDQMENSLSYHRPSDAQVKVINDLRQTQKAYALFMETVCPAGRELALAKTYFETSCMWAVKAVVINAEKE